MSPARPRARKPGRAGRRRTRWPTRWWTRTLAVIAVVVLALGLTVAVDAVLLRHRIDRVDVALPVADGAQTWVLVGSDSRSTAPTGSGAFGSVAQAPGDHADAVVLVREDGAHTSAVSVPRDVLVSPRSGVVSRLALLLEQPQDLVDGLCRTLHVSASHLVVVSMAAFGASVDAVGGVDVEVPAPVRDVGSGLDLARAGRVRLDGAEALALVRSRHPEVLADGRWSPVTDAAGAAGRTLSVGTVFAALAARARSASGRPWALQSLAWALTGGLRVDSGTDLRELAGFGRSGPAAGGVSDLPVAEVPGGDGVGATADDATFGALAAAGFGDTCTTTG